MPFAEPQLPRHKQRRWWLEAFSDWLSVSVEEFAIRSIRFPYIIVTFGVLALLAYWLAKMFGVAP